jgi:hypothetical protein
MQKVRVGTHHESCWFLVRVSHQEEAAHPVMRATSTVSGQGTPGQMVWRGQPSPGCSSRRAPPTCALPGFMVTSLGRHPGPGSSRLAGSGGRVLVVKDAMPAGWLKPGPGALEDHQKGHKLYLVCLVLHKRMQRVDTSMLPPSHVRQS